MSKEECFHGLKSEFEITKNNVALEQKSIGFAGYTIVMHFAGTALISTFFDAFAHLEIECPEDDNENVLNIYFWDSESTATSVVNAPWEGQERHHLGLIESYTDDLFYTLQQPGSDAIYMLNKQQNEAIYWVDSASKIPYWESDFPLRMIFHWWLIDTPYQPVHAAAVGTEKGGLLLVGKGGSGKSTSTVSCLNSKLKIAGDDYILLDTNGNVAHSLFSLSKLNEQSIKLLNYEELNTQTLNEPIDGKYRIKLYPKFKNSLIHDIPIKGILLPQVTDEKETIIVPCGPAQSMLALAPTTLFQLPGLREQSFKKMSNFVRRVKSYHLFIGTDPVNLSDKFESFLNSLD